MAATTELNILVKLRDEASQALGKVGQSLQGLAKQTEPALLASQAVAGGLLAIGAAGVAGSVIAVNAAREHMVNLNQLDAVLKSTGHAAGLFKEDIIDQANALSMLTNYDDDAILAGQNLLLTFTNIKGPVMQEATQAMVDMAAAMGTDVKGGAIQLGKALNDPIQGITALTRVGVSFSEEQKKTIQALVETGKTADAQRIILAELAKEFGGSAEAQRDPIIMLKKSMGDLAKAVGMELLPVVNKLAEFAQDFVYNHIEPWIQSTKDLINWLKQHKEVVIIVAGAIAGALIPALLALLPVIWGMVTAFAASAVALAPFIIGGAIIGGVVAGVLWLIKHWDLVIAKATEVWQWVVAQFTAMRDAVVEVLTGIGEFFKTIFDAYIAVWKFAISFMVGLVITIFNAMGIDIVGIFQSIGQFFVQFWNDVVQAFTIALTAVQSTWSAGWTAIKNFITPIWDSIKNTVNGAFQWLKDIFSKAIAPIEAVWTGMWERVGGVVGTVFDSVKETVKSSINWVVDKLNALIRAVNSVASKGAGALGLSIPQIPEIPRLAKGGIVTRPTLALIGEAGPEAVVPLTGRNAAAAGMGGGITINFNAPFYGGEDAIRDLGDALAMQIKRRIHVNF